MNLIGSPLMLKEKRRTQKIKKSQLDNIEGIGEALKKRLLLNFKSLKNIKTAKIEELMTIKGINEKIANNIKLNFKNFNE